ncbi:MAG TPA: DMT family protein [Gemmataceae bacterium]|nr:DMT family protein [Gemmataceae bacterium]
MWTVLLLIGSNVFMTIAWYGHLRYKGFPLWSVILVSWLIALPEYALQVPANRLGYGQFSATQLKIIQEIISVSTFVVFGYFYLNETLTWKTATAFLFILAAVALAASDRETRPQLATQQVESATVKEAV